MKWGLVIGNRAKRQLRRLTNSERHQIDDAFSELRLNPYHGDVQFIKGSDGALRRRTGAQSNCSHGGQTSRIKHVLTMKE